MKRIASFLIFLGAVASCAHLQNVGVACKGTITDDLLAKVASAAAQLDYMDVIIQAAPVEECMIVAAAKELYASLNGSQPKMRASIALNATPVDHVVVKEHLANWLAVHGGAK